MGIWISGNELGTILRRVHLQHYTLVKVGSFTKQVKMGYKNIGFFEIAFTFLHFPAADIRYNKLMKKCKKEKWKFVGLFYFKEIEASSIILINFL